MYYNKGEGTFPLYFNHERNNVKNQNTNSSSQSH